ncbi:hypothetical protein EJV47_16350 [Hymenobacter gummosus]|uniref:STAS/SEC14 domain-containing protein n=1 Tax=Hymenobacter gummosus TaxID=1776032 RepID=A0A431U0U5_9BACT|nr:hypothetical protein [Hymenobacter gummosus]RTQ48542.1 hypothetical protein EJV47_16350 [Hymenobacter gummosus]
MPPSSVPYFENAAARLSEDAAGFVHLYWKAAPRTFGDTQVVFTHLAEVLRRRGWGRVLINQQVMLPFSVEEQRWIAEQWLPRAVQEAGYRFGAVVVARDVLTRLATAYVTTHVQGLPLVYRSFETEAEAEAWLGAQAG